MMVQKIKKLAVSLVVLFFIGSVSSFTLFALTEFSAEKAKRVELTLKRIAKKRKKHDVFLKKVTFSQDELNSYLNMIYVKRYTPEVKYINLKLGKKNTVDGTIKIKLVGKKYEKVPAFLRDVEVDVSGKVECQNYRMRVQFEKISVNGTSFSPELLDEAFGAAQADFKIKKSMYDWFNLLPGIKNIVLDHKKVTLFY
jgi:hypothetical protein